MFSEELPTDPPEEINSLFQDNELISGQSESDKEKFYKEVENCFPEITIPNDILENLFDQVEGWASDAESIEEEIKNAVEFNQEFINETTGTFLGWNDPTIVKLVSQKMGLKYRPFDWESDHSEEWKQVLWHKVKGLIALADEPFEQSDKSYVGREVRREILAHSTINRIANIASALLGVEAGKVFGQKILEIAGKNKTVETYLAVLINGAIFWVLTAIAENTIASASYTRLERIWLFWVSGVNGISVIQLLAT